MKYLKALLKSGHRSEEGQGVYIGGGTIAVVLIIILLILIF